MAVSICEKRFGNAGLDVKEPVILRPYVHQDLPDLGAYRRFRETSHALHNSDSCPFRVSVFLQAGYPQRFQFRNLCLAENRVVYSRNLPVPCFSFNFLELFKGSPVSRSMRKTYLFILPLLFLSLSCAIPVRGSGERPTAESFRHERRESLFLRRLRSRTLNPLMKKCTYSVRTAKVT